MTRRGYPAPIERSRLVTNYNMSGNYEMRAAMDAHELKQQQEQETCLAHHGRISG